MEFFHHDVTFDWMGKAKYFVALSLTLLIVGTASWIHRGLDYGVDFKGGTLVYVRFAGAPPMDQLRAGLVKQGLGQSVIQQISGDISNPNVNEVTIDLPQQGQGDQAIDAGKTDIENALRATLGTGEAGKQDFNAASPEAVADALTRKDPLGLGANAGNRYQQLAAQLIDYRDHQAGGVAANLDDLRGANASVTPAVIAALRDSFYPSSFAVVNTEIVGPKVGSELRRQAVYVTLYALAGMLIYIAFRFEWVYGAAAVLAVFHDVLITLGLFSLFHFEISLTVIAALLTLVGYSMNDTIVIFDRIRENLRLMRREPFETIVNRSINQTLSRTILTSGLTFLTVLVLFLMGGEVLHPFSFALVVGILVGTYSSFGIAAPLVVAWNHWRDGGAVPLSGSTGIKARTGETQARLAPAGRR
jgi:preprotein translocase subunit SecF